MKNGDMPIHPIVDPVDGTLEDASIFPLTALASGLSKREYFAAMAMQGLVTACMEDGIWAHDPSCAAENAVKYADDLLTELAKEQGDV